MSARVVFAAGSSLAAERTLLARLEDATHPRSPSTVPSKRADGRECAADPSSSAASHQQRVDRMWARPGELHE